MYTSTTQVHGKELGSCPKEENLPPTSNASSGWQYSSSKFVSSKNLTKLCSSSSSLKQGNKGREDVSRDGFPIRPRKNSTLSSPLEFTAVAYSREGQSALRQIISRNTSFTVSVVGCAVLQHVEINRDGVVLLPVLHNAVAGGDDTKHPARVMVGNALRCFSEADFLRRKIPREQTKMKTIGDRCWR